MDIANMTGEDIHSYAMLKLNGEGYEEITKLAEALQAFPEKKEFLARAVDAYIYGYMTVDEEDDLHGFQRAPFILNAIDACTKYPEFLVAVPDTVAERMKNMLQEDIFCMFRDTFSMFSDRPHYLSKFTSEMLSEDVARRLSKGRFKSASSALEAVMLRAPKEADRLLEKVTPDTINTLLGGLLAKGEGVYFGYGLGKYKNYPRLLEKLTPEIVSEKLGSYFANSKDTSFAYIIEGLKLYPELFACITPEMVRKAFTSQTFLDTAHILKAVKEHDSLLSEVSPELMAEKVGELWARPDYLNQAVFTLEKHPALLTSFPSVLAPIVQENLSAPKDLLRSFVALKQTPKLQEMVRKVYAEQNLFVHASSLGLENRPFIMGMTGHTDELVVHTVDHSWREEKAPVPTMLNQWSLAKNAVTEPPYSAKVEVLRDLFHQMVTYPETPEATRSAARNVIDQTGLHLK